MGDLIHQVVLGGGGFLHVKHLKSQDGKPQRALYLVYNAGWYMPSVLILPELRRHEVKLNTGRFERFSKIEGHSIDLKFTTMLKFQEYVEWIQKHTKGRWWFSFPGIDDDRNWRFEFDDFNEALMFKLTWSGM